jgi:hypothetical protein
MVPTSVRPGCSRWPLGQRSGGLTIHCPSVQRTSSPTAGTPPSLGLFDADPFASSPSTARTHARHGIPVGG